MISEKKQTQLDRYRSLLLATLDYLLKRNGGIIVYDGDDPMTEFYTVQKIEAEKYYEQGRLDRLKARLTQQINTLQHMVDLDFESYIKTTTGYDIDIFDSLQKRVDAILENDAIRNDKDLSDIITMRRYCEITLENKNLNKLFESLINDYSTKSVKKNTGHSHVINRIEKDGIEEVKMISYSGPKLKHYSEQEKLSPDGKLKLAVTQRSVGNTNSTTVSVKFPKANGEIYRVNNVCKDIKAYWKDNRTVVIETKKDDEAYPQYQQLRSFDYLINIEYVEK